MDIFPALRTNAVTQYPATRELTLPCQVYTYVDGSEQRVRDSASVVRRWTIRLTHVSDAESNAVIEFFRQQRGRAGTFLFADPWTGTTHTACFDNDSLDVMYVDDNRSRIELTIRELGE